MVVVSGSSYCIPSIPILQGGGGPPKVHPFERQDSEWVGHDGSLTWPQLKATDNKTKIPRFFTA